MNHRQDFWNGEIKNSKYLLLHKAIKNWEEITKINFLRALQINHILTKIQGAFIPEKNAEFQQKQLALHYYCPIPLPPTKLSSSLENQQPPNHGSCEYIVNIYYLIIKTT